MGILNIQPATREGAHLLIQLPGGPRSGKTLTGLLLARGLAGPNGKVGVLDTESGRARLYADKIPGGYFVGELSPPYTPERYCLAIEEFLAAKVDVLVIDSGSHIWEGPGGVLEQADLNEKSGKKGLLKWLKPKVAYRKFVAFLMSTKMHIIICSRAKQPMLEKVVDGKTIYEAQPWEPIQDKRLKYEMTVVLPMLLDGTYETDPTRMKCPGDLRHLFKGELLTVETGAKIAEWVGGAQTIDHDAEMLLKRAGDVARDGMEALRAFFKACSRDEQKQLKAHEENLKSIAAASDEAKDDQVDTTDDGKGGGQALEGDKPAADPFAGRKDPETKVAADKPTLAPLLPKPREDKNWDAWKNDALNAVAELKDDELAEADMELNQVPGIPNVTHTAVAKAIRERSSKGRK